MSLVQNNPDGRDTWLGDRSGNAFDGDSRRVMGEEINFGWWSRNSQRDDSFDDLFQWKYGRRPTRTESDTITDGTAKKWFTEKYTSKSWVGTFPPVNVNTYIKTEGIKYCWPVDARYVQSGSYLTCGGKIRFPNGKECDLIMTNPIPGNGWVNRIRVSMPCSGCQ